MTAFVAEAHGEEICEQMAAFALSNPKPARPLPPTFQPFGQLN
jgi:hypothetical protein